MVKALLIVDVTVLSSKDTKWQRWLQPLRGKEEEGKRSLIHVGCHFKNNFKGAILKKGVLAFYPGVPDGEGNELPISDASHADLGSNNNNNSNNNTLNA